MSRQAESLIKEEIADYLCILRRRGLLDFWYSPNIWLVKGMHIRSRHLRKGVPDITLMFNGGQSGWIEVKAPKGILSEEQEMFRDNCEQRGHFWMLARGIADVHRIAQYGFGGRTKPI